MSAPSAPPQLHVALVDMRRLFDSHPRTKTAEAELNVKRAESKIEFQHLIDRGDESAAQEFRETRTKDIEAQSHSARAQIVRDLQSCVDAIAARQKLDVIFDSSGKSLNGVPLILNASGITDITSDIIDEVDRTVAR